MDTPSFIQSLDLPTPGDGAFFDSLHNDANQASTNFNANPEYNDGPVLDHLEGFPVQNNGDDFQREDDPTFTGALTKLSHPIAPLPKLSESVIPSSLPIPKHAAFPDFLQGNNAPRQQTLIAAPKKKKEPQGPKTRPAFVMKIWLMVNDPANHNYIRWSDDGESFLVVHREDFMKNILPKYFKHNNFASFVRQLNMYGWHKIQDVTSGSMKEDRSQEEVLQFKNPKFVRDREDLLDSIVRNKAGSADETQEIGQMNLQLVISELELIKMNQLAIMEDMRRMRKDNQLLWNESFSTRDRYQKQSQTLDKIVKFLATIYGNSAGKIFEVEDGIGNYNGNQVSSYNNSTPSTNYTTPAPISKPRLMLMDQEFPGSFEGTPKSPSSATGGRDSIEEIVRNTPDFRSNVESPAHANKIYQQIMNLNSVGVSSPSQYFPELSNFNPNQDFSAEHEKARDKGTDMLQGLENNIMKQGQALLQVQDWIQALASKQQQQDQLIQQQRNVKVEEPLPPISRLDDFDVNDFLNNGSIGSHSPIPDQAPDDHGEKRVIEEVNEESRKQPAKRRRQV